ncbi:MAG TPA: hypothetical protein VLK35_02140 [Methylomirabilota bacterium]|nr:hypothetical protein [Methylomirabilota bacterium]
MTTNTTTPGLDPSLAGQLSAFALEAYQLTTLLSRKPGARKREAATRRVGELREEIERLVPPPPFETSDNGVHVYVETDSYLILRNHGDPYWTGMLRERRGGACGGVVTAGDLDAADVLRRTIAAADDAARQLPASRLAAEMEARAYVREREDEEVDSDDLFEVFAALYGRAPDAEDHEAGLWSLCCAAL